MTTKRIFTRALSILLMLCLLPLPGLARSASPMNALYQASLEALGSVNLADRNKLEKIADLLRQAGFYESSVQYLMFVDAVLILLGDDTADFDEALDKITSISKPENRKFLESYQAIANLPDLGELTQYIRARKLQAYGDVQGAAALYDQVPAVLDASLRSYGIRNEVKKEQYDQAVSLMAQGTLTAYNQAADIFSSLGSYRDSTIKLAECEAKIAELTTPVPTRTKSPTLTPVPAIRPPDSVWTTVGSDAVDIRWTIVRDAQKYYVYRTDAAMGNSMFLATVGNKTEYRDASVQRGHTYDYHVISVRDDLESEPSVKAAAAVPAHAPTKKPTPSPAPTIRPPDTVYITIGSNSVTIRWTPVDGAQTYRVYRGGWLLDTVSGTVLTDVSVEPGQTYDYTVSSVKGRLESERTAAVKAAIPTPVPTKKPTPAPTRKPTPTPTKKPAASTVSNISSISAAAASSTSVRVSWTESGTGSFRYTVSVKAGGAPRFTPRDTTSAKSCVIEQLAPNTAYVIQVSAPGGNTLQKTVTLPEPEKYRNYSYRWNQCSFYWIDEGDSVFEDNYHRVKALKGASIQSELNTRDFCLYLKYNFVATKEDKSWNRLIALRLPDGNTYTMEESSQVTGAWTWVHSYWVVDNMLAAIYGDYGYFPSGKYVFNVYFDEKFAGTTSINVE